MNIKPLVYETLTPEQRLVAAMEASSRDDQDELRRLFKTCPRKIYEQADAAFLDKWDRVVAITLAIELDIAQAALRACMFYFTEASSNQQKGRRTGFDAKVAMQCFGAMNEAIDLAVIEEAASRRFERMGIPRETWQKFRPSRNLVVEFWRDLAPEPIEFDVEMFLDVMTECDRAANINNE